MLESIRSGAQSFWVKLAFGVIILVFVFWGVGNFNERDFTNVVAVVNGQPILALEFEKAYRNAEEYVLSQNPGMTREQLAKEHLGRQVLRDLIELALVRQEAGRTGVEISPRELLRHVSAIRAFQDDNGRFDPEAYRRVLEARRVSPAQYEKELSDQLLRDRMFALVTAPVWVDGDEAKRRYDFLRERRVLDYIFVPEKEFLDAATASPEEIRAWYDSHKDSFAVPPRVDVEYLSLSPADIVPPASVPESEARAWYENNKASFYEAPAVKAAHILVPLPEDADEAATSAAEEKIEKIREELKKGRPFPAAADEYNQPGAAGPGGDLGWLEQGKTVEPFEAAAFALKPGEISDVVRTPFGLHLIRLEERRDGRQKDFAEAEKACREAVAAELGADRLHEALDNLIEDNILQKPMPEIGSRYGLRAQQSGLLDEAGLQEKLGVSADGAKALLAVSKGMPLDTALEAGQNFIIARVSASEPAGTRPLEAVTDEISALVRAEKAMTGAVQKAEEILGNLQTGKLDDGAARKLGLTQAGPLDRGQPPAGFEPDVSFSAAVFDAPIGSWLPRPYTVKGEKGQGAILARPEKSLPPEAGEYETVAGIMQNGVKRERQDAVYALFLQNLLDRAKVQITNQDLIDRVNM